MSRDFNLICLHYCLFLINRNPYARRCRFILPGDISKSLSLSSMLTSLSSSISSIDASDGWWRTVLVRDFGLLRRRKPRITRLRLSTLDCDVSLRLPALESLFELLSDMLPSLSWVDTCLCLPLGAGASSKSSSELLIKFSSSFSEEDEIPLDDRSLSSSSSLKPVTEFPRVYFLFFLFSMLL